MITVASPWVFADSPGSRANSDYMFEDDPPPKCPDDGDDLHHA